MAAARAPRVLVLITLGLTLVAGLAPASVAASTALPLPTKMAAVGDSITQAASSAGSLGSDAPQNSWSTGTSSTVNSHYLRLLAAGAQISGQNHNRSVSGAKMVNLASQMDTLATIQPDYVTVLMGGNDLCTDTVDQMTSVTNYRSQFSTAMTTLSAQSPNTNVYVVSVPNVYQLWNLFKDNAWARFVWVSAGICQSLLANPTSTQTADVQRREMVRQRNIDYNTQLAQVCAAFVKCLFDGNAAFNTAFIANDVSGDYFHPSVAGQAKLASVSWSAGYTWLPPAPTNQPPSASFTESCAGLTCTFTDASTDADGTITAYSWNFGDNTGSTTRSPSHTYTSAGTYAVSLTVTDDDAASGSTSRQITVSAPPEAAKMRIASLTGSAANGNKTTWRASVVITVSDTAGAPVAGATVSGTWTVGAADTCTTGSTGTCTVQSDNLSRRTISSVTFTVTGVTHATLAYDSSANAETSETIAKP